MGAVRRGTDANPIVRVLPEGADRHRAVCFTGDCEWAKAGPVKVAMQEQARWHRQWHRRQVAADLGEEDL